jgi:protein tyrosine phosphatase (PTP) superfamily phosphohydrolase (DUF442 family)
MKLAVVLVGLAGLGALAITSVAQTAAPRVPKKLDAPTLPNAYQVTDKVISGGQPDGDAGYAALEKLGVKTVVSVDGAKPDVETARQHGMRYVHLPHGYDGIGEERMLDLAKAIRDLPGPIYVHCHHGKHRSPAAAAAACVEAGAITTDEALAVLKAAGTSPDYRGLYRTVRGAKPQAAETLDGWRVEFHEVVPVAPMAEAMVAVEHTHDHLKQVAAAGWMAPPDHPDIDPPHEALLLVEHFTELLRTDEVEQQPKGFMEIMRRTQADAQKLESGLRKRDLGVVELTGLFDKITADCKGCHTAYRDVPIQEKGR